MDYKFNSIYYTWDSYGFVNLYFDLTEITNFCLFFDYTNFHLKENVCFSKLNKFDISFISLDDRIIREIRQDEMFQTFFLLNDNSIIKVFNTGHTENGFIYTFTIYRPSEKYYQEYLLEEYSESEILSLSFN